MGKIIILAEKPDIGTRLAATLGGCYINGVELKPDMVNDKKYEGAIKKERSTKGYFKCKYQNRDYIVTWGYGHIGELKQAKDYKAIYKKWDENIFPFIPKEYEIKVKEDANLIKHLERIKGFFNDKETEYIIDATDADREGVLIFDYIYRLAQSNKPIKRLWISSYTEEAIIDGFNNLKSEDDIKDLRSAGRCRAIADWIVGSNLTVLSTLKFGGYKNMVSIGRVQTPTLAIMVERELEVIDFKASDYYELIGEFLTPKQEVFTCKWKDANTDRFPSLKKAQEVFDKVNNKDGIVTQYKESKTVEKPPLLFDLTSLQMVANSRFGFSAKDTLDIAQKLYEKQLITYPRTNSRYLTTDMKDEVKKVIKSLPGKYDSIKNSLTKLNFTKRNFDNSKVESHYAIIPTYKNPTSLNASETKIYELVAESLLKIFMDDAVWGSVKIDVDVVGESFFASGRMLLTEGWRELEPKSRADDTLPVIKKGDKAISDKYEILKKQTKPPKRYTEKTLLSLMETAGKLVEDSELRDAMKDHGIGTPATRAAIIEKLISVGYITRSGKVLVPTPKGIEVIRVLPIEDIKSPTLTGKWEYDLKEIERGKLSPEVFVESIEKFVYSWSDQIKKAKRKEASVDGKIGECPNCNSPVVENQKGWGCSDWRNGCKFQIWKGDKCGKKITKTMAKQLLNKGTTTQIKGFISQKGKPFDAKLVLEKDGNGKIKFDFSKK